MRMSITASYTSTAIPFRKYCPDTGITDRVLRLGVDAAVKPSQRRANMINIVVVLRDAC